MQHQFASAARTKLICSTPLHHSWCSSFSFSFHVRKQCAEAEMKTSFCVLAAFQHGRQVSGAGLGQHPYGGETPWTSGGATANAPEKGGEPHHGSTALLPPPTTLCCGLGVQRAFPHHPRGPLVEEKRYCTDLSNNLKLFARLSCRVWHTALCLTSDTHHTHTYPHKHTHIPACCINSVP